MTPRIPPPDPHESLGMEPARELPVPVETAVFLGRAATVDEARVAEAVLGLRPGVLIVAAPR